MTTTLQAAAKSSEPQPIWPDGIPALVVPYTPAIKVNEWVFVSGFIASDFKTGMAAETRAANPNLADDMELQARYLLANAGRTLKAAGCDISRDLVRIAQWFPSEHPTRAELEQGVTWPAINVDPYLRVRDNVFSTSHPSAITLSLRSFPVRNTRVGVEIFGFADDKASVSIPQPHAHASSARTTAGVRRGDWVFLSSRGAVDATGGIATAATPDARIWHGSAVEAQTEYVLQQLSDLAEQAGSSLRRAVKAEVYLGHPRNFAGMDRVWRRFFPDNPPARSVVPNVGFGVRGVEIEIALTLLSDDSALKPETVQTSDAPEPFSHEPQALKVGNLLFLSQQLPCDSKGRIGEGLSRNPEFPWYGQPGRAQTRSMIGNIAAICEAAGSNLENVVRCARIFNDPQWFAESFAEWDSHFPKRKCTSIPLHVGGDLVVPGANVMFDVIAYVPD